MGRRRSERSQLSWAFLHQETSYPHNSSSRVGPAIHFLQPMHTDEMKCHYSGSSTRGTPKCTGPTLPQWRLTSRGSLYCISPIKNASSDTLKTKNAPLFSTAGLFIVVRHFDTLFVVVGLGYAFDTSPVAQLDSLSLVTSGFSARISFPSSGPRFKTPLMKLQLIWLPMKTL